MSDNPSSMTARQEKWFASILESLERETGKTMDEWVAIALTCPETKPGARKAWFKAVHGIGTNRASIILGKAKVVDEWTISEPIPVDYLASK